MPEIRARLICAGCGFEVPADEALPFRCPRHREGDDIDHLLQVRWERGAPTLEEAVEVGLAEAATNPFQRWRARSFSYAKALERGMSDAAYVELVEELDAAVAAVDGAGFRFTPWHHEPALGTWIKDETGNVAGSHKARHLFGLALFVEVAERTGLVAPGQLGTADRPLAIASCGNAALAAAVVARAWQRTLRVFVPPTAPTSTVTRLVELGAELITCRRTATAPPGDPCLHAFLEAVEAGALPFTVQGHANGLTIEGGKTLGFELAAQHRGAAPLEHLFLQVGGGALASATCQALGAERMPKVHAVQTLGCHPIVHAWRKLAADLRDALGARAALPPDSTAGDEPLAGWLLRHADPEVTARVLASARQHRSRYMRPWSEPATSVATGILDDETYDWFEVVRAMLVTGGWPIVVAESELTQAREEAQARTGIPVEATGSAGLAGLIQTRARGHIPSNAQAAVLFTGIQRADSGGSPP